MECKCGCGTTVYHGKKFVSGHNLRDMKRSDAHRAAISKAQTNAWASKRKRMPIGSTKIDRDGYVRVKVVAGKGYWRPQHLIVMEEMLGRPLVKGEVVHHVNGVRSDNRPENLFLCENRSHHNKVHSSQDSALRACLELGIVVFKDGRYELADNPPERD